MSALRFIYSNVIHLNKIQSVGALALIN